jgi:hypothetical protein
LNFDSESYSASTPFVCSNAAAAEETLNQILKRLANADVIKKDTLLLKESLRFISSFFAQK